MLFLTYKIRSEGRVALVTLVKSLFVILTWVSVFIPAFVARGEEKRSPALIRLEKIDERDLYNRFLKAINVGVGTGVDNHNLTGKSNTFKQGVDKIFCLSRIEGAKPQVKTKINHIWYYEDIKVQTIILNIKSASYRTYSFRSINPNQVGKWRVDVTEEDGHILKTVDFNIVKRID